MAERRAGDGLSRDVFDERERAYETKYRHDQEIAFKVDARCARLFGLWAAEQLGLAAEAAEAYAHAASAADLAKPNHSELFKKVSADLTAYGAAPSETILRAEYERLLERARAQIEGDLASGRQRLERGF